MPNQVTVPASASSEEASRGVRSPEMILVPAGNFLMGTSGQQVLALLQKEDWAKEWQDKGLFQGEQPQHSLALPAYRIGIAPVTNAEYQIFVWETGQKVPKGWDGFRYPDERGDFPVVNISLGDAQAYCAWLSKQYDQTYRLPTEAEWERAARGTDGRMYPWGEEFDPWRCNTLESSKNGTTIIRAYSPAGDSPVGCTDMSGNVFEWTSSILGQYPFNPAAPAEKIDANTKYVVRGGAWYYSHKLARCPAREGVIATYISPALGFRLVNPL
jgi:toxoflavin biosynthesis protein ToxD